MFSDGNKISLFATYQHRSRFWRRKKKTEIDVCHYFLKKKQKLKNAFGTIRNFLRSLKVIHNIHAYNDYIILSLQENGLHNLRVAIDDFGDSWSVIVAATGAYI